MTKLITLQTHEPGLNLAAEEFVFSECNMPAVMLWQNENAIIVGRNQNTLSEINAEKVAERKVSVVRRITGGGAVYHDLGNVNYSVIVPEGEGDALNFKKFAAPVVELLNEFGVKAEFSGRNDLLIDGKKFSGNAQHISNGRILHHGTLMFSSDLDAINDILTVNPDKIKSKAVASVRSRVTTIAEHLPSGVNLTVEGFIRALERKFGESGDCEKYEFTPDEIKKINTLADGKYRTWAWNYGVSPKYSFTKTTYTQAGTIETHLDIKDGKIIRAAVFGDFFALRPTDSFTETLIGVAHEEKALLSLFERLDINAFFAGVTPDILIKCFF